MPAVGLAVFAAPSARAQTAPNVTAIQSPVLRFDGNQKASATRNGIPVNVVNYDDCESGRTYQFNLTIQNPSAPYTLVAYAGRGDCTYYPARSGSSPTCFPVGTISATDTTASVNVSMKALTGIVFPASSNTTGSTGDVCTQQSTPTGSSTTIWFFFVDKNGYALGTAEAYPVTVDTVVQGVSDSALQAVLSTSDQSLTVSVPFSDDSDTVSWNIYYTPHAGQEQPVNAIAFDAGSNNGVCPDASAQDSATSQEASAPPVDASEDALTEAAAASDGGPLPNDAPLDDGSVSDASSEAGDDAATVTDASSTTDAGPTATDSGPVTGSVCGTGVAEAGVTLEANSCVPSDVLRSGGVTSTTVTVDAGDGGSGATTTTYKGTPTQPNSALDALLIESVAIGTTSVTIPALKDGYYYLVGVAAVDAAGNVGPLAVGCAQPNPPVDFYSVYRGSGGLAGGGFCSTEGPGADVPATTSLALLGLASLAAVFRKRRRTS